MSEETCLKCGKGFEGEEAVDIRRGNGFCKVCAGRKRVTLYVVICANTELHFFEEEDCDGIFHYASQAEDERQELEAQKPDCGPHRVVTLRSNRVRIMASNADQKKAGQPS